MREASVSVSDADFEAIGIGDLLALSREAGIRDLKELVCHGTGAVLQVTVGTRYEESALSGLDCVDSWEYITETGRGHLYIIAFTAPELPDSVSERSEDLLGDCDPDVGAGGATMSFVGPQESIAETIDAFETAGVSPNLQRLGPYDGRHQPLDELTDRQRQVIETAYEMGYYEVPKTVSSTEIAAELGVDPSTVSEHLQRAERNLIEDVLD